MPSSGSTSQPTSARSPPSSSPKTGRSGADSASAARMTPLARGVGVAHPVARPLLHDGAIASPEARRSTTRATGMRRVVGGGEQRSRSRSATAAHGSIAVADDRAAPGWRRRHLAPRVGVGGRRAHGHARRRRRRPPRGTRASRRGSPTGRPSSPPASEAVEPPAATSQSSSATEPSARNCFHGSGRCGQPVHATTESSTRSTVGGAQRSPVAPAPLRRGPRCCRSPVTWFATSAHSGPSASNAHSEIAQYGMPREQLVDPSTGIEHDGDLARRRARCDPDSSLTHRHAGRVRARRARPRRRRDRARTDPGRRCGSRRSARGDAATACSLRGRGVVRRGRGARRRSWSERHQLDQRVVVGDARRGIARPSLEQHVALGEEHLHVARPEAGVAARGRGARRGPSARGRARRRRDRARRRRRRPCRSRRGVAPVSGSRSRNVIVLNCLPRRVLSRRTGPRGLDASAARRRRRSAPARRGSGTRRPRRAARRPTAPGRRCRAGPRCRRTAGTTRAISSRTACPDANRMRCGPLRVHPCREVGEDLPLAARLADARAGDLGAEDDAALGGGLGAAVALLVARGRGQEHHGVVAASTSIWLDTTMSWCTRSGTRARHCSTRAGSGRTSRKLPPLE